MEIKRFLLFSLFTNFLFYKFMKKFIISLFVVAGIIALSMTFGSCTKDDFESEDSGISRDINPPMEMFQSEADYGSYYEVYIEAEDIVNPLFFGKYSAGYATTYDEYGYRTDKVFYSDFYKIKAKKSYGMYRGKLHIAAYPDFVLVSAEDLARIKKLITQKGSATASIFGEQITNQWIRLSDIK